MVWLAVYSQSGRTLGARDELQRKGLNTFCPVERLTKRRKMANRNKFRIETKVTPVFGRYLFAQGHEGAVRETQWVHDLVRAGPWALTISDAVIEHMRELTEWVDGVGDLMGSRDISKLRSGFRGEVGQSFRFTGGVFAGFTGVISSLAKLDKHGVIRSSVELFGRQQTIDVDRQFVELLSRVDLSRPGESGGSRHMAA